MEQISDSPEGVILEAVLEASAEYYSLELSQKVKRGLKLSVEKGLFTGGHVLFGYKVVDKKIMIDEDKAEVIRYLFSEYANGTKKKQIINEINRRGYRNANGKPFGITAFQNAMQNPKYIGKNYYNGILSPDSYPPIIDEQTFNAVQKRLASVRHAPATAKARVSYQFQGKGFCGHCGTKLVGDAGTGKSGKVYNYYSCGKRKRYNTCKKRAIEKDYLEWHIVEQTIKRVLEPKRMKMIAQNVVAQYEKDFNSKNIANLEKQIARLEKQINKLADDFIEAPSGSTIRKRISEKSEGLSVRLEDAQIDLYKQRIAYGIKITEEGVIAWLKMFTIGNPLDPAFRDRIIETFINCIYVYDRWVTVYYNLTEDNKDTVDYETEQGNLIDFDFDDDPDDDPPCGSGDENEKTTPTENGQGGSMGDVRISNAPPRQI